MIVTPSFRIWLKASVILLLAIAISGVVAYKISQSNMISTKQAANPLENREILPTLIEFGSVTCIPCKKMKPILEELNQEYAGQLQTIFVDAEIYEKLTEKYKIEIWPTQVFLDDIGNEIFRHEGFFPKEDILQQWKDLGFEFIKREKTEPAKNASESSTLVHLFTQLNHALTQTAWIALLASLVWGILSILLSPCHLSSIPLIIGFLSQQEKMSSRKAFGMTSIFSFGILFTICLVGLITGLAGRILGDVGPYTNYIVSVIFFVIGLYLLEVIEFSWNLPNFLSKTRRGYIGACLLGIIFGTAVGPCTFAYMAPMLGVTFKVASHHLGYAILLVLAYSIGHCGIIILAGTSIHKVQSYLDWTEKSYGTILAKKICGVLLLCAGLYLIYIA